MRTYVVTGSASGIGAATAARLQDQGHRVIGVDLKNADVQVDLATDEGRRGVVDEVAAMVDGSLDAVIACAGVSLDGDPLMVRVNYFGAVATLEGLRPLLAAGTDPRAAVVSSMSMLHGVDERIVEACLDGDEERACEFAPEAGLITYASTKKALSRWLRRVAITDEWAGAGIALNAPAPGVVTTPMTQDLRGSEEGRELLEASVPMPLYGHSRPEDIAAWLDWLTSPGQRAATGQIIYTDGGADAVMRGDAAF